MNMDEHTQWNLRVLDFDPKWACCANCKHFDGVDTCALLEAVPDIDVGITDYCTSYEGYGIKPRYPNPDAVPQFDKPELHYLENAVEQYFWDDETKLKLLTKIRKLLGGSK